MAASPQEAGRCTRFEAASRRGRPRRAYVEDHAGTAASHHAQARAAHAGAAVGALLAADVSGSETWAGLGGTAQTLGGALAALVVARVMAAKGRRPA